MMNLKVIQNETNVLVYNLWYNLWCCLFVLCLASNAVNIILFALVYYFFWVHKLFIFISSVEKFSNSTILS